MPDLLQLSRMANYIHAVFPIGTPLDELDVDLISQLPSGNDLRRPVLRAWAFRLGTLIVEALVFSPAAVPGLASGASVNYKHMFELWLETLRAEYAEELARSPLERGAVLGEDRTLNTCFAAGEEGGFEVSSSSSSVSPLVPVDLDFAVDAEITDVTAASATVRSRAVQTVTRWNALEQRFNAFLTNLAGVPPGGSPLESPRVAGVLVERWAKMAPEDERNLGLDHAANALGLSAEQKRLLYKAGARDLRGIARALKGAAAIELQNQETERIKKEIEPAECDRLTRRRFDIVPPDPIEFPLTSSAVSELRMRIAVALAGGYEPRHATRKARRGK